MLTKCFSGYNLSHPTRTIKWNAYKGSNIILNIDGSSLSNPCVSGFSGLTQNADGAFGFTILWVILIIQTSCMLS